MKKTGLFLLLCVTLLSAMILPISAQEAFTVDHLAITIDVEEDGTYLVKESYLLDFSQYRHGFYRNIPTKYEKRAVHKQKIIIFRLMISPAVIPIRAISMLTAVWW